MLRPRKKPAPNNLGKDESLSVVGQADFARREISGQREKSFPANASLLPKKT
jgi:hypothetical protein